MSRYDPHTIPLSFNGRLNTSVSDVRGRVAAIERTGGGGSTTVGGVTVGDATTVVKGKLKLSGHLAGTADTPILSTTAEPQILGLGIGIAATTDYPLSIGLGNGQWGIDDTQGDLLKAYHGVATGPYGRWNLSQGAIASPYTTEEPTLAVHRTQEITAATRTALGITQGNADNQWHASIAGIARANAADLSMVTGVVGAAHQFSTTGTAEADACGIWSIGAHHGIGGGFGAYIEGRISATSGVPGSGARCRGLEVRTSNYETTPTDSPYVATPYYNNKMNAIQMSTNVGNDNTKLSGNGILFYRPSAANFAQYDVGIACTADNTPIRNSFIRDDGGSVTSIDIRGTHTNAISIAQGAGMFNDLQGDPTYFFSEVIDPLRWEFCHGTAAAPVTTPGPSVKFSRIEEQDGAAYAGSGTSPAAFCTMQVFNEGTAATTAQPVAIMARATSAATTAESYPDLNPDATGIMGFGYIEPSGVGRALGAYFQAQIGVGAGAASRLSGVEVQVTNNNADHTYNALGGNSYGQLITNSGSKHTAVGLGFNHTGSDVGRFDAGIAILGTNPITDVSFRDDGAADYSIHIAGTHPEAAIAVDFGSGKALFGVSATTMDTLGLFVSPVATDSALTVQGFASQSVNIFSVLDASATELFGVGPEGAVRVKATAGKGYIAFTEQSSPPSNALTGTARLYAEASGATTVLKYKDDAGTIATLQTGVGGGGTLSTTSNSSHLDFSASTSTNVTASILTTATPRLAGLGIGATSPTMGMTVAGSSTGTNTPEASGQEVLSLGPGATTWNATAGSRTAGIFQPHTTWYFDDFSNGVNYRNAGYSGAQNDDPRLLGNDLFGYVGAAASTYFFGSYTAAPFNSKGLFVGHQVTVTVNKPTGSTVASFDNYNEGICYVGGTVIKNKGSVSKAYEGALTIHSTTTGNSDSGVAAATGMWMTAYEHNPYADYTYFTTQDFYIDAGSQGHTIGSFGTKRLGTGLFLYSGAQANDEAAGESAFYRAIVLTDTAGIDQFCLDGFGRIGLGVTRDQTQNTAGLPAKIVLATDTTAAGGIQFGTTTPCTLYRSAADTLKTDDSFTVVGTTTLAATNISGAVGMTSSLAMQNTTGSGFITLFEQGSSVGAITADDRCRIYMKGDKFVIQYNHGGTTKYRYLDLTDTAVTWTYTTTAP